MIPVRRIVLWCACMCSGATPLSAQPAPHAAHDTRFGGRFATAAGDTLHLEAAWSEQRRVRLFVTDASGSPLPLERLRGIDARAIAGDRESPFALLESEHYFEARIATLRVPAVIGVSLKPSALAPEERLTFSFPELSASVIISSTPVEIPATLKGILDALADERKGALASIDDGQMLELLGAEDRIRDLVLAIEPYLERLPVAARSDAQDAMTAVIRACWLLHTVMDYGLNAQRDAAVKQLGAALDRTVAALSGIAE